jgi:hypothetical protein
MNTGKEGHPTCYKVIVESRENPYIKTNTTEQTSRMTVRPLQRIRAQERKGRRTLRIKKMQK